MKIEQFKNFIGANKQKFIIFSIVTLLIIITSLLILSKAGQQAGQKRIIAKYDGGVVTLAEAQKALKKINAQQKEQKNINFLALDLTQQELLLKEIIGKKIAYQEALKRKLNKTKKYKLAIETLKTELLVQDLYEDIAQEVLTEAKMQEEYNNLITELQDKTEVKISIIIVAEEQKAQKIYNLVRKNPKSFKEQAKQHSLDQISGKNGGNMGYVFKDSLSPEILANFANFKIGKVNSPINLGDKWVLVKLEDERAAVIPEYDNIKAIISESIAKKSVQDFILNKIDKANISININ
ncbi:MAG: peptidylprolyl isomerase [Rickettsiales bacterium]